MSDIVMTHTNRYTQEDNLADRAEPVAHYCNMAITILQETGKIIPCDV